MALAGNDIDIAVRADRTAACEARRAIAACGLVDTAQEPTLVLLVSELVTNSVRHAGIDEDDQIRLRAVTEEHCAYVEVCDPGRHPDGEPSIRPRNTEALEPGGLGLQLVDAMADRWGVRRDDGETCVWFELAHAS